MAMGLTTVNGENPFLRSFLLILVETMQFISNCVSLNLPKSISLPLVVSVLIILWSVLPIKSHTASSWKNSTKNFIWNLKRLKLSSKMPIPLLTQCWKQNTFIWRNWKNAMDNKSLKVKSKFQKAPRWSK